MVIRDHTTKEMASWRYREDVMPGYVLHETNEMRRCGTADAERCVVPSWNDRCVRSQGGAFEGKVGRQSFVLNGSWSARVLVVVSSPRAMMSID